MERRIDLREQLFYILNQHNMNMILNLGAFNEVDTVKRIRVADKFVNIHVFGQQEALVDGIKFNEQNVRCLWNEA
jgi:hypothetical protein